MHRLSLIKSLIILFLISLPYGISKENPKLLIAESHTQVQLKKERKRKRKRKRKKKRKKRRKKKRKNRKKRLKNNNVSSKIVKKMNLQFGHEFSYFLKKDSEKVDVNKGFLSLNFTSSYKTQKSPTIYSYNFDGTTKYGNGLEYSLRSFNLNRLSDFSNLTFGIQDISWGETFGFQIADIVCPRDYRDPLDSKRLSIVALNYKFFYANFTFQAIYSFPRNNKLPDKNSNYFPLSNFNLPSFEYESYEELSDNLNVKSAEWGGKINYFFDFGLDLSLFYFNHWNRNILYKLEIDNSGLIISPVKEREYSIGLSYTYAFDKIVLRGDGIIHFDHPVIGDQIGSYQKTAFTQIILGIDYTTDSNSNFALQFHGDYSKDVSVYWTGINIRSDLFKKRIEWKFMVFKGINNKDMWLQPKLTWIILKNLSFSIQFDIYDGVKNPNVEDLKKELFSLYKDHDRVLTKINLHF